MWVEEDFRGPDGQIRRFPVETPIIQQVPQPTGSGSDTQRRQTPWQPEPRRPGYGTPRKTLPTPQPEAEPHVHKGDCCPSIINKNILKVDGKVIGAAVREAVADALDAAGWFESRTAIATPDDTTASLDCCGNRREFLLALRNSKFRNTETSIDWKRIYGRGSLPAGSLSRWTWGQYVTNAGSNRQIWEFWMRGKTGYYRVTCHPH